MLTPGIYNSAYFEHSFLAQQMGVELVEGRDLVVADDECVYMRTTRGLERVDVIYRRIDDTFLDPECFDKDSVLGVPGSCTPTARATSRSRTRRAPASPTTRSSTPTCRRSSSTTSARRRSCRTCRRCSCATPRAASACSPISSKLVVKPANESGGYGMLIGPRATDEEKAAMAAAVEANPRNYIAQPMLALSTAPTLVQGEIEPRHVDLRPFILHGRGVCVMPGGLTRVALRRGSLVVNSSQGGGSKDTWIVAVKP